MSIDLGKRLMDCTLGEYIAAERTIGILSGWAIALFTVLLAGIGRYFYKKWKKTQPEESLYKANLDHARRMNSGERVCKRYSPQGEYLCTLLFRHPGVHAAHDHTGDVVLTWDRSPEEP